MITVESVDFDPMVGLLRINGRVASENAHVKVRRISWNKNHTDNGCMIEKMGSYHTIDLELNRNFTLLKPEWDTIALERVEDACDITKNADVVAIVCQEGKAIANHVVGWIFNSLSCSIIGLANLCFLTQHMTIVKQRVEMPIPRKRKGSVTNHEKGLARFYDQIYQAMMRTVDFSIVKAIILASPGFVKVRRRTRPRKGFRQG